jgi:hypothetical protein
VSRSCSVPSGLPPGRIKAHVPLFLTTSRCPSSIVAKPTFCNSFRAVISAILPTPDRHIKLCSKGKQNHKHFVVVRQNSPTCSVSNALAIRVNNEIGKISYALDVQSAALKAAFEAAHAALLVIRRPKSRRVPCASPSAPVFVTTIVRNRESPSDKRSLWCGSSCSQDLRR